MAILVPGESAQLQAIRYSNGLSADLTRSAVWTSSEPSVVTVSPGGLALAVGPGQAVVSAAAESLVSTVGVRVTAVHERLSGHIDPETARDIIDHNQEASSNKHKGTITRFDLPIPIYIDPSFVARFDDCALRAISSWQSLTRLPFVLLAQKVEPRLEMVALVTEDRRARTYTESVNLDNSQRVISVIMPATWTSRCSTDNEVTTIHELGHALGMHGHPLWDGVMSPSYGGYKWTEGSAREVRFLVELHKLPLGAHVEPDGTWVVR